jgi:hypothetical protein
MTGSRIFFTIFAALLALVGLFAAAASHDYLHVFGLMLFAFGVVFALSCVKRHFDEAEAVRH